MGNYLVGCSSGFALFLFFSILLSFSWADTASLKNPSYRVYKSETGNIRLPSFPAIDGRTLADARRLIDHAIIEIGKVNGARILNPRRNTYDKSHRMKNMYNNEVNQSSLLTPDVLEAAAVLAELHVATVGSNSTGEIQLPEGITLQRTAKVPDKSFWMEKIGHSGQMPFGNDRKYKVCAILCMKCYF
jgi:hypothetical protein